MVNTAKMTVFFERGPSFFKLTKTASGSFLMAKLFFPLFPQQNRSSFFLSSTAENQNKAFCLSSGLFNEERGGAELFNFFS